MTSRRPTAILLSLLLGGTLAAQPPLPEVSLAAVGAAELSPARSLIALQEVDPASPSDRPAAAEPPARDAIAQRLTAIAAPPGPPIPESEICRAAAIAAADCVCLPPVPPRRSHLGRSDDQACETLIAGVASHLRSRVQQVQAYAALQAFLGVAAASELAAAQLESLEALDELEAQQRIAQESGFAVPNPLRVERLKLQVRDAAAQIAGGEAEARQQLLLLTAAPWACDFAAVPSPPRLCESRPLCDLLAEARVRRGELAALRLWQRHLACGGEACWPTLASLVNAHAGCGLPAAFAIPSPLAKLFDRRGQEEAAQRRRCLIAAAADAMEKQIDAEVTEAYYACRTAAERAAVAQELLALGERRREQLEQYGDQVAALSGERLETLAEEASDRTELLRRRQEYRLASLRLEHAIGMTCGE